MAANISGAAGLAGGAVADLMGSKGSKISAAGYRLAAGSYRKAADLALQDKAYAEQSTAIQLQQSERTIYKTIGGQRADVAGAGFKESGSAIDLLRDSTAQGEMTMNMLTIQGKINADSWQQQSDAYNAQAIAAEYAAKAADNAAKGALISGIVKGVGAIGSIAML